MLTPLSLVAGLLIALLASRVWANVDHANTYVANEASALRRSVLLADNLPPTLSRAVRRAINLFVFATALAICPVVLMVNDRPFSAGGNRVTPRALHELNSLSQYPLVPNRNS
ncbi:MAG: hypothetical protein ACREFP_09110 [Acetobacteraceae bacterium]